jgi:hypothetical protein
MILSIFERVKTLSKNIAKLAVLVAAIVTIAHSLVPHLHDQKIEGISAETTLEDNVFYQMFALDLGERHLEEIPVPSFSSWMPAVGVELEKRYMLAKGFILQGYSAPFVAALLFDSSDLRGPPRITG